MSKFDYVTPTLDQVMAMDYVREAFKSLESSINEHVPDGRYKALVFTKLEEAAMFAHKGVSHSE